MKFGAFLFVFLCVAGTVAHANERWTRMPALRKAIIRDAKLSGVQAASLVISTAESGYGYGSVTWSTGTVGGVFVYHVIPGDYFPYSDAKRMILIAKYDRMPDPCALRKIGVNSIAAFYLVGETSPGLCEPEVITDGMHDLFNAALSKARWQAEDVVVREITVSGNYALVEMDRNDSLHADNNTYSQGFQKTGRNWKLAPFTSDVCSMSEAKVPWSVASKFIAASARIAYELEQEDIVPHGAHCRDTYDKKLLKL